MCVFVCPDKQAASCQQGGVKRPGGFEHSCPAKLTVCLDNGIFPPPSPPPPSPSLPLLKISADRKGPPLLHHCQRMSILSSFISVLPLSAIISPPLFSSLRSVHPPPLLQSNPTAINQLLVSSRGWGGYLHPFRSSLSFPSSPYIFSLLVILSSLSCFLVFVFLSRSLTAFISFP